MTAEDSHVRSSFAALQEQICATLENLDGKGHFDGETLETAGGGITKPQVLSKGKYIEKAAVLFSFTNGDKLPPAATERNPQLAGMPFTAIAISVIVHPFNPHVPTTHMNLRFFYVRSEPAVWYFGGGFDLTPYVVNVDDFKLWHQFALRACHETERYKRFKQQCDDYFYLAHRQETRGVGGIFFDDWQHENGFAASLSQTLDVGNCFRQAYGEIFERRRNEKWTEEEEQWMLIRRGRYAEFNLAIDRGTKYGLQSGRRVESVLSSLPPRAIWEYDRKARKGTFEAELQTYLRKGVDWLDVVDNFVD